MLHFIFINNESQMIAIFIWGEFLFALQTLQQNTFTYIVE